MVFGIVEIPNDLVEPIDPEYEEDTDEEIMDVTEEVVYEGHT